MTGYTDETLSGKLYTELLAKIAPYIENAMDKALLEGRPQMIPETALQLKRDDNEEAIWASLVYSPVKNRNVNISRIAVWLIENSAQGLNEELTAINEELAATNEEFAAAKEELATANEELTSINGENLFAPIVRLFSIG